MDYMNLYKRIILTPQDGVNLSSLQARNRMYFKLKSYQQLSGITAN